jgi:hypothetical protein
MKGKQMMACLLSEIRSNREEAREEKKNNQANMYANQA